MLQRLAELERTGETFAALQCDARQHRDDSAKLHELVLSACSGVMTGAGTATGSGSPLIDKLSNLSKSYVDVVEQNEKLRAEIQSGGLVVGAGAPADGQKAPLPEGWELAVEPGSDYVYFVDHSTQSTSWVDPRTGRAQQSTQQPQARKQMEDKIRGKPPIPRSQTVYALYCGREPMLRLPMRWRGGEVNVCCWDQSKVSTRRVNINSCETVQLNRGFPERHGPDLI